MKLAYTKTYSYAEAIAAAMTPHGQGPADTTKETQSRTWFREPSREFDDNTSMLQALDMAHNGWSGFDNQFSKALGQLTVNVDHQTIDRVFSEAGDEVDVGRYLDGEPDAFLECRLNDTTGNGPIVELVINGSVACFVSESTIKRRGAAILALCNALEASGKSVGITYATSISAGDKNLELFTRIKEPFEYIQPSRLAFCLCHPAFYRRICFRLIELIPAKHHDTFMVWSGKGYASDLITTPPMYLPRLGSGSEFENDDTTKAWLLDQLKKLEITVN